ncbi:DMT family transporter [Nitrospinota bacterium]
MIELAAVFGLCAALCLSLRDILGRMAVREIDPIVGTGVSALVGIPVLGLVSALIGDFRHPWPGWDWPLFHIALAGLLRITAARTLLFAASRHIGAARAGTLASTSTFFAMLLGMTFLGETLTLLLGAGAVLVVGGCVLLARSHAGPAIPETRAEIFKGVVLALAGAVAFGTSTALVRPAVGFFASPNQANLYANVFAVLGYLPIAAGRFRGARAGEWPARTWRLLALAGASASLGVTFVYLALSRAPVVFVSPITQTRPLFVVAISWLFIQSHERVNWRVAVGAAVIFGGTALLILGR